MTGFRRSGVLLLLGLACSSLTLIQQPQAAGESGREAGVVIRSVQVEPVGTGRRLTMALDGEPLGVQSESSSVPPRLVIDIDGPMTGEPPPISHFPLSDAVVSQVRIGAHGERLRVVLDLARELGAHDVRLRGSDLVVDLGETRTAAAPAAPEENGRGTEGARFLSVRDVAVDPSKEGRHLALRFTRPPDGWRHFVLDDPPRLVIDVQGPQPERPRRLARYPVEDDVVAGVRAASDGRRLRVVVDWHAEFGSHRLRQEGASLLVDVGEVRPATFEPAADAARIVPAVATTPLSEDDDVASNDNGHRTSGGEMPEVVESPVRLVQAAATAAAASGTPSAQPGARLQARLAPPRPSGVPKPKLRPVGHPPVGYRGERISLDFKDADIQNVLRVLADVSGLNLIATDDVRGKVTLHLTDVPWDQALDLVMRSNRLEMIREGNVARISTVARLKEEREALRAAQEAEKELEPLRVEYIRVNYARADEALVDKVKGVLTDRGSVTFDERTNTIVVRDIPRGIADASELIRELDVQSPQVLIEANIVEATESFGRALGIQWGYQHLAGPQTGNITGSNFPGTVSVGGSGLGSGTVVAADPSVPQTAVPFQTDFPVPPGFGSGFGPGTGSALDLALGSLDGANSLRARLTALEEEGKGRVVSRPRVITMNNVPATIQSLTIIRVKLPSTGTVINTGTGGAAGSASNATEKINTGITLVVTPQISADGFILMNIFAKSSQPDFSRTVDGIPNEISREANSNVLVKNGETVVLGGIFRHTEDDREAGIPYLRSIPALGWLFKRMLKNDQREELLVFLTPKIVSTGNGNMPLADTLSEDQS